MHTLKSSHQAERKRYDIIAIIQGAQIVRLGKTGGLNCQDRTRFNLCKQVHVMFFVELESVVVGRLAQCDTSPMFPMSAYCVFARVTVGLKRDNLTSYETHSNLLAFYENPKQSPHILRNPRRICCLHEIIARNGNHETHRRPCHWPLHRSLVHFSRTSTLHRPLYAGLGRQCGENDAAFPSGVLVSQSVV